MKKKNNTELFELHVSIIKWRKLDKILLVMISD